MVLDKRPDELFAEVLQRGLSTFKEVVEGVSTTIRTGDSALKEIDDALTGSKPRFGETPQETFTNVMTMLEGTLLEAKEKGSAGAPTVTQRARDVLARINAVEPPWRPGPSTIRTVSDMFRSALRDLRASNSLIRLAQGTGKLEDLDGLSKWAEDLNARLEQLKAPASPQEAPAPAGEAPAPAKTKKAKKDTALKTKPNSVNSSASVFARAMAEVMGDDQVAKWASQVEAGEITEDRFIDLWGSRVEKSKLDAEELLSKAKTRAIEKGLSPDDDYIKEMP